MISQLTGNLYWTELEDEVCNVFSVHHKIHFYFDKKDFEYKNKIAIANFVYGMISGIWIKLIEPVGSEEIVICYDKEEIFQTLSNDLETVKKLLLLYLAQKQINTDQLKFENNLNILFHLIK